MRPNVYTTRYLALENARVQVKGGKYILNSKNIELHLSILFYCRVATMTGFLFQFLQPWSVVCECEGRAGATLAPSQFSASLRCIDCCDVVARSGNTAMTASFPSDLQRHFSSSLSVNGVFSLSLLLVYELNSTRFFPHHPPLLLLETVLLSYYKIFLLPALNFQHNYTYRTLLLIV